MYIPHLVENEIKYVLNVNLKECHDLKLKYYNFVFNLFCFIFVVSIIGIILYYKYKGHLNINEQREKENKKRDYILSNLRKFQNIKNKHITNIPLE